MDFKLQKDCISMKTKLAFIGLSILFCLLASSAALGEGRFERFDFTLRGEVTDVIIEDLNEDGFSEAIVIHIDAKSDPPDRFLTIFLHDPEKGFDKNRKIEWTFPAEVSAVDVGDVKPEPGRELVFITEKGVSCACVKNGRISPSYEMIPVQSVVAIAYERDVPYYNFVRDYTGDGRDDILVCGFYDALLAVQNDDYTFTQQKINLRPAMGVSAFDSGGMMTNQENPMFRVSYRVPQIFVADYNGDGRQDIFASFRKKISIYSQDPGGSFSVDPVRTYKMELFEDDETSSHRRPPSNLAVEDLDGDNKADIIVNQVNGNISKLDSRTVLYYGKSDNVKKGKPDVEFKTQSPVMGRVMIQDINKDGRPDLIMPTFALNAWSVGKALLTGDVNLDYAYFLQRPDKTYAATPDRTVTTDLKFNIGKFRLESGVPNLMGDFNGDGYPDQVLGENEQVLVITPRDAEGKPMTDIVERINMPVSMMPRTVNLNGDSLSDLVIHYRERDEWKGDLRLLINKGPWTAPE